MTVANTRHTIRIVVSQYAFSSRFLHWVVVVISPFHFWVVVKPVMTFLVLLLISFPSDQFERYPYEKTFALFLLVTIRC